MPFFRQLFRSLTFRVIAFSSVWAVLALIVIATVISTLFRQASERGFESLLSAHLFNLISAVNVADEGILTGLPNLSDLRFAQPQSGWYWTVEPVSSNLRGELSSPSMTGPVPGVSTSVVPFDDRFQRRYRALGLAGEELEVIESEFVLDDENRVARFRMMGNRTELESEIAAFERQLYTYLSVFGLGMIGINAVAIFLGLIPLGKVSRALARIREGSAQRLDGRFPTEIAPLASETNALIESNKRIIERSRTQVGNLAHSLKTPLAVIQNEGRALDDAKGKLIAEQASLMRDQVEHYLQRARMAAQRESVVFRTPVAETLQRLVRVTRKLSPDKELKLILPEEELIFSGEREDLEEIVGNLLENAMKWAAGKARISVETGADDAEGERFRLTVEDDGPGIPDDKAREAVKRGRRLDESKPGTGLGLSIVADLVSEYGGALSLSRSDLGGLKVDLILQRVDA
ncbi:ATP-binding protein [Mesorhizobium sp. Z1-4]|uniref:ATP-binding protein n=1 Tax=Mesorhizobium sp. Z1-4 TaxID=2448478 RepID=UPI000FDABDA9|nr:ATP-binding protein [Mesorhizobium sp. Z1-4]